VFVMALDIIISKENPKRKPTGNMSASFLTIPDVISKVSTLY